MVHFTMAPPTPSSHRPRKKTKASTAPGSNNTLIVNGGNGKQSPAFPLVSFLWAARANVSQWLILPLTLMAVGLFRWAVSLWGYSGTYINSSTRLPQQLTSVRFPGSADVWRLRGTKALDGDYHTPAHGKMVPL